MAAYKIRALDASEAEHVKDILYLVESILPMNWVGHFTAVTKT